MSFFGKWNTALLAGALLLALNGCSPMDSGPMDEEKEPHFVLGKSRVNALDYEGAIEAFDESLEANPHSAQAHYQLAMLYENQDSVADPAAAIYHYEQYLKYDPKADNADLITQRIAACKQKLAANVLQLPPTPAAQQQVEKLVEENRRLRDQLAQWQAYYAAEQAAKTNQQVQQYNNYSTQPNYNTAQSQPTSPTPDDITSQPVGGTTTFAGSSHGTSASSGSASTHLTVVQHRSSTSRTSSRTHVVLHGETLASIARKAGVSIPALEAANPYVNPNKIRAGQVLNLPP